MNDEHDISESLDAYEPRAVSDATLDRVRQSVASLPDTPRRRLSLRLVGALAAAACLVIGVSLYWNGGSVPDPFERVVTLESGWRILPIGDADYTAEPTDHIRLTRGELRITSTRDDAEQLTITTDAGQAIARGTDFYIGSHTPSPPTPEAPAMKRLTRILVLTGMVTLTNPLGSVTGSANELLAAEADAKPVKTTVTANSDFAIDLYHQLGKENTGKNLFFSPYSISNALVMTMEGARGKTMAEMGDVLGFPEAARRTGDDAQKLPWETAQIHTGFSQLNERFNKADKPYKLAVANALWGEKTYPFEQAYIKRINQFHETGGLFPMDFAGDPEGSRKHINGWIEDQTNDRIKELIPKRAIDPLTALVLTNAIYFKGDWATQFKKEKTVDRDFTRADGTKVKTPIMYEKLKVSYATDQIGEDERVHMVALPYKGDDLSMVLIQSASGKPLDSVEKHMDSANLTKWVGRLGRKTNVNVHLPRFKMESEYKLNKTLKTMGIKAAFGRAADFSGLTASANDLYISAVLHKGFIDVNEEGTEAAATTVVAISSYAGPFIPTFRGEKPFVYLIRDNHTGAILFMGRMMDPTAK